MVYMKKKTSLNLTKPQIGQLEAALEQFKQRYGISHEGYHYTSYAERIETDQFVAGGGASRSSKAHSTDFHLKVRIGSQMYAAKLPIFGTFDFGRIKTLVEPVVYNCSRDTVPWPEVKRVLLAEADDLDA